MPVSSKDRYSYIPPTIERAMTQHMQQTMPSHMKQYANSGGYIPSHMEKSMTQHMQKALPSHMQQYVGAYMQQKVVSPNRGTNAASFKQASASQANPHTPTPYMRAQTHFQPSNRQVSGEPPGDISGPPDPGYDFLSEPEKPKFTLSLGSMKLKIILVSVIALVIIIGGVVLGNILGANQEAQKARLIEVAQAQTEIVRLSTLAESKAQNHEAKMLAINTKLSVESAANDTRVGLSKYGVKADAKLLGQGKNSKSDEILEQASSSSNFDEAYKKLMQEQLSNYQKLLKSAFESGGKTEKIFLNNAGNSNALIIQTFESN